MRFNQADPPKITGRLASRDSRLHALKIGGEYPGGILIHSQYFHVNIDILLSKPQDLFYQSRSLSTVSETLLVKSSGRQENVFCGMLIARNRMRTYKTCKFIELVHSITGLNLHARTEVLIESSSDYSVC